MPVHDWTRVAPEIFHDLYVAWFAELQNVFNNRLLPDDHYALIEQKATPLNRALAIRHVSGHHLVALIEILSPANKDRPSNLDDFAAKAVAALDAGIHVLVVDVFPPGAHDPQGIYGVLHQRLEGSETIYDLPTDEPLTLASYTAGPQLDVYLEHLAVGAALPEMPLFLRPDRYVNVPLESTYQAAYEGIAGVLAGGVGYVPQSA